MFRTSSAAGLLATLLLAALTPSAGAQGIGTPGYYIGYAADYAKAGKAKEAEGYLQQCLSMFPDNAQCRALLAEAKAAQAGTPPGRTAPAAGPAAPRDEAAVNTYRVGDTVEVSYAGGWNRGVVTKIEGSGRSVYATVDYTFSGERRTASFFYNGLRPAAGRYTPPPAKSVSANSKLSPAEQTCLVRYNACYASSNHCGSNGCQPDFLAQSQCRQQQIACSARAR